MNKEKEECIKTNNVMKFYTHEQMVDKHIGVKGTPERESYDEEVEKCLSGNTNCWASAAMQKKQP